MTTQTTSRHSYLLSRTAVAVIIAAMAAGCSAAIERFEEPIYTGGTNNQRQILSGRSSQPSFEDISAGPTSSNVKSGKVESVALPPPGQTPASATGSIPAAAHTSAAAAGAGTKVSRGWTTTGGTQITARGGDTLASVSRRYGVPEKALADANGLDAGASLKAGQNLIVPIYVYGGSPATAARPTASVSGSLPAEAAPAVAGIPQRKPAGRQVQLASAQKTVTDAASAGTPRPKTEVRQVASNTVKAVAPAEAPVIQPASYAASEPAPAVARDAEKQAVSTSDPDAGRFRWPVHGRIISDFGAKPGGSRNDGINLAVPEGTDVKAVEDGVVIYAGNELKGYGNLVLIRHNDGWVSAYAHNSKLNVSRGDTVRRGDTVSYAGATGSVTQPQVHFELRKGNKPVDPLRYLAKL